MTPEPRSNMNRNARATRERERATQLASAQSAPSLGRRVPADKTTAPPPKLNTAHTYMRPRQPSATAVRGIGERKPLPTVLLAVGTEDTHGSGGRVSQLHAE